MRSRARHEEWIKTLKCPVLWIEGDTSVKERVALVKSKIEEIGIS